MEPIRQRESNQKTLTKEELRALSKGMLKALYDFERADTAYFFERNATLIEIARKLGETVEDTLKVLHHLELLGLVREDNENDMLVVKLTEEGRRFVESGYKGIRLDQV